MPETTLDPSTTTAAPDAPHHAVAGDELAIHQSDLARTQTLKGGALFLLTDEAGSIPPQSAPHTDRGLGLYFHDTRYLDTSLLLLNGLPLIPLLVSGDLGFRGVRELTNPDLPVADTVIPKETLGFHIETTLGKELHETITCRNFGRTPLDLELTLAYEAHYADIFTVRGMPEGQRGTLHAPETHGELLRFCYDGADGHRRTTTIRFDPPPTRIVGTRALFAVHLEPGVERTYALNIALTDELSAVAPAAFLARPVRPVVPDGAAIADRLLGGTVRIETSNELFNRVLRRSFLDLNMLATRHGEDQFFAAGVPWFVALFGRDSIITALQTLAYAPHVGRTTLDLLARYQGRVHNPDRDEDPGKILHELRIGERANLGEVPFTPYYGTIDATPLFLILLGEYLQWTGDRAYFATIRPQVEAALAWLDSAGDPDGDGFLEYAVQARRGLFNQGWKDSGNAIVNADGSIATPPIALVEVQGYAYRARRAIANIYRHFGDESRARRLEGQAATLQEAFARQFWLPEQQNYAFALQGEVGAKRPVVTDASNQGQALWGGIVASEHAAAVRDTVMDPARLFAGWGIRTLSHAATAYNPFDYQTGAIWPHDSALIAAGLRTYGFDQEALRIFTGLYEVATRFDLYRLPELFAGFGRDQYETPVRYPVACSPQAWAAGSIPYLLQSILGLNPDAFNRRLYVTRPCLPEWLHWVTITDLRVGDGTTDLRFERSGTTVLAAASRKTGDLQVSIEY
jgi:glycogen debranching enzyme